MIPESAFKDIIEELEKKPLEINKYRLKSGGGRSQVFGVVNRRSISSDYSRNCWLRPKLYYHILEFAKQYVDISFNAITINQNYKADKHYDKNNKGISYIVGFGDYEKGDLLIHESDMSGNYNIKHNPIKGDFSKMLHSVEPFTGNRYSLVFYMFEKKCEKDLVLPPPSVKIIDGKYQFFRGDVMIDKKNGLPHNLKKKKE